jgi:hypothetical protein
MPVRKPFSFSGSFNMFDDDDVMNCPALPCAVQLDDDMMTSAVLN